ncbi:hypothetical protein [Salirhabdus salicampi]|uniref:hypothetical protein n=1 Tax=Salirhabdus salicampi TaxID=476102 RepID=UPI0020C3FED4|nr:hypothetical protein [Salirhabdus salicampi]MCP8615284.1 hypothetical protein [Salirhabdus salicampi]
MIAIDQVVAILKEKEELRNQRIDTLHQDTGIDFSQGDVIPSYASFIEDPGEDVESLMLRLCRMTDLFARVYEVFEENGIAIDEFMGEWDVNSILKMLFPTKKDLFEVIDEYVTYGKTDEDMILYLFGK